MTRINIKLLITSLAVFLLTACQQEQKVDVLIIDGGASGTAAGIQVARMGANTLIAEEHEWLGGALTSAGVSCIDGGYTTYTPELPNTLTTIKEAYTLLCQLSKSITGKVVTAPLEKQLSPWEVLNLTNRTSERHITRREFAVLLDFIIATFSTVDVDIHGKIKNN